MFKKLLSKYFESVFEMGVLLVLFFAGALMLAAWPMNESLKQWIVSGPIVMVVARALGSRGNSQNPPTDGK